MRWEDVSINVIWAVALVIGVLLVGRCTQAERIARVEANERTIARCLSGGGEWISDNCIKGE